MIRNIYAEEVINDTECYLNPVSLTVPDEALTIRQLFERYAEGAQDICRYIGTRKQVYDALENESLDFDDVVDDLTPNEAFEALMTLKEKRERLTKEEEAQKTKAEELLKERTSDSSALDSEEESQK
ncbi:hypothetical protein [Sigmofec virus UA08Rod_6404]|uniref:Uncharacterized protein n=1 Tax=Sigmofec virus UA08Rod_6404 TaxID=2929229 RepID=A0A976N0D8_9VIRU|nr:hypothetical protein [Sigmofec virus UA08Rod_6404]